MAARRIPEWIPITFLIAAFAILFSLLISVLKTRNPGPQPLHVNYRELVCDNAWQNDIQEPEVNHFTVEFHEGCFGKIVRLPEGQHAWHLQPVGNDPQWWVAIWVQDATHPFGVFDRDQFQKLTTIPGRSFRFQGEEGAEVLFYTDDVVHSVTSSNGSSSPKSDESTTATPEKRLSHVTTEEADPHICEKPDDSYYAHYGPAVPHPAGYQDYSNPNFLFDTRHEDQVVNWTNGFTGTVPVCFIVNEQGNPEDIRFVQSPGKDIEDHIRKQLSGWRYEPGRYDDKPIRVQLAFKLIFR